MLLLMMVWYGHPVGPQMLLLPVFVALAFVASLGVGLWLSALNVEFRDVRYVIPFLTQLWLLSTPILYSSTAVTTPWKRVLLGLNPMSGVVEGFRWTMLGKPSPGPMLVVSIATVLVMLASGAVWKFGDMGEVLVLCGTNESVTAVLAGAVSSAPPNVTASWEDTV